MGVDKESAYDVFRKDKEKKADPTSYAIKEDQNAFLSHQSNIIADNHALEINDIYEYDCVVINDKWDGGIDADKLSKAINLHAALGWRLVNTFTNELGKNASSFGGIGTNSTIEQTVLVFERCLKRYKK